jgi:hypothetical protein
MEVPQFNKSNKAWQSKSKFKSMMFFSYIRGNVHVDCVPEDLTLNQVYYKEVLTNFRESLGRKSTEIWKNVLWVLYQENSPGQNAMVINNFL